MKKNFPKSRPNSSSNQTKMHSQGKIVYKEKSSNQDDDQKLLAQKKKRQENINKRTNIVENQSLLDHEFVLQEQMYEEYRIEGSKIEGSRFERSRREGSRREGSRREGSRREGSRREPSRREGTFNRRLEDIHECSIKKGEGSKLSLLNVISQVNPHKQSRNDSHRRQDSKHKPMSESSKFSIIQVNENSQLQKSNLQAFQLEEFLMPMSGTQIGSQKQRNQGSRKTENQHVTEMSYKRMSVQQNSFLQSLTQAIEKIEEPERKKSLHMQQSVILECSNEEESSFLRGGSKHKSLSKQSGEEDKQFFRMGTQKKSKKIVVSNMWSSESSRKNINNEKEDPSLKMESKKLSIIGGSINELNNQPQLSLFRRSVSQKKSKEIKKSTIQQLSYKKLKTFVIKEEEEDIQDMPSIDVIRGLMEDNGDNFSDSQPVSMFDKKSSKQSTLPKDQKMLQIHKKLALLPKNLLNNYELELSEVEKSFQSQGTIGIKRAVDFIGQTLNGNLHDKSIGGEQTNIYIEDDDDSNKFKQINSSQWQSASREQLNDRTQKIESRLEHLMNALLKYNSKQTPLNLVGYQSDDEFQEPNVDDDEQDEDEEDCDEEDYADEYYDQYPEDVYNDKSQEGSDNEDDDEYDYANEDEDDQEDDQDDSYEYDNANMSQGTINENLEEDYDILAARDPYSDYYSLKIIQVHDIRWIKSEYIKYHDNYPLLTIRKLLFVIIELMFVISYRIVLSNKWVFFILFATVTNISSFLIFRYESQSEIYRVLQFSFLCMYTFEVFVKLLGHGLKKYYDDYWNFYDLLILLLYAVYVYDKNWMPFDVSTFRVIRIPFFLSTFNKKLFIMLTSLQVSFIHLMETLLIVLIFSGFFSLIALHLFSGVLHYICFDLESGLFVLPSQACGYTQCPSLQSCLYRDENPDIPTSYDNFIFAYIQVLRTITQNEWVEPMYQTMRAFHPSTFVLYILIILIGEKFCFNLVIAVLKVQYAETTKFFETHEMEEEVHEHQVQLNLRILKDIKLYQQLKQTIAKYKNFISVKTLGGPLNKHAVYKSYDSPERASELKKESKEVKLLSGRQRNMVDKYKKKMQKAFENSSWFLTWLLPHHPIQKHMKQIIVDQENIFLKYYDLQLYYRFRSLDFLSLNVSLKSQNEIEYYSSSQMQVLELRENQRRIDQEKMIMSQKIPLLYPQEQYTSIRVVHKADIIKLPLLKRIKIIIDDVYSDSSVDDSSQEKASRDFVLTSPARSNSIKKDEIKSLEDISVKKKIFDRKNSLVSQQLGKLFQENQSYIASSDDDDDSQQEEVIEKPFCMAGEVREYDDLAQLINQPIEEVGEKPKEIDYKDKYMKLRMHEANMGTIKQYLWSGDQVLQYTKYEKRTYKQMQALNDTDEMKKKNRFMYLYHLLEKNALKVINSSGTAIFIDLCILVNTIMLSLQGLAEDQIIEIFDSCLNFVLLFELFVKVIAQREFFDSWNGITQSTIVLLSLIQMLTSDIQHSYSQNQFLIDAITYTQVIKALLFFRIIQYNKFARKLMYIAYKTLPQYINLTLLMFFIILTYSLLGLQIFGDHFDTKTERGQLHSFGDAAKGWLSVFDVSTMDNWYSIMILGTTHADTAATIVFCVTMVFLINYLMKELLMAIILEEFSQYLLEYDHDNFNDTEDDEQNEGEENLEQNFGQNNEDLLLNGDNQSFQISSGDSEKSQEKNYRQLQLMNQTNPNKTSIDYFRKIELKMKKDYFTLKTILDRLTEQQRNKALYENVDCQCSFFIFGKTDVFRQLCHRIILTKSFEIFFVLNFIITLSSMVLFTFVDHELFLDNISQQYIQRLILQINLITNSLIIAEGLIKMIVFGCFNDRGSYFSDTLVGIDFIYCCIYNVSAIYPAPQLLFFNMMGYLRPLRLLAIFRTFEEERKALFNSISHILNILFVLLMFWFIFAIFGVKIYKGKMAYCSEQMEFFITEETCYHEGKDWIIFKHNFENIFEAISTLFIIATLDEWGTIMQICMNGTITGPEPFANQWVTYVYFVIFVFVGSMFFLGFFAGILFIKFKESKSLILNPDLNQNQMHFLKISKTILNEKTYYSDPPRLWLRVIVYKLIQNKFWHYFVVLTLISNIIILAMFHLEASQSYSHNLNQFHHILSGVFILDTLFKILSYHVVRYFSHVWRIIEFLISLHALIDLLIDVRYKWFDLYLSTNATDTNFILIRLCFILRDIRVLLIIQEFIGIQRLLHVIQFSLGSLSKLLCLVVIVMMVYSFFGCFLFGSITKGNVITDQHNFENFFSAMLTLFRISGRNGWRGVLADCASNLNPFCATDKHQCGQPIIIVYIYFFSFMIIITYSLLNLFILSLVDEFESFYAIHNSVIETYIENIDKFRNVWCKFSFEKKGVKMHTKFLAKFLLLLGEPLGSQDGDNIWDAAKNASSFQIKSDQFGYLHFKELLYETVKYSFRDKIFEGGTYEGFRQMKQHDKKMRYRLQFIRDINVRREVVNPVIELNGNFNILQEYLFVYMALKTWKSYAGKVIQINIEQFIENAQDFTNSYRFTEKEEMDSEESRDSQEAIDIQEDKTEVEDLKKNVSPSSYSSGDEKVFCDELVYYDQKPKVTLKVSFLDRIYQQRVKDNILFKPKQT